MDIYCKSLPGVVLKLRSHPSGGKEFRKGESTVWYHNWLRSANGTRNAKYSVMTRWVLHCESTVHSDAKSTPKEKQWIHQGTIQTSYTGKNLSRIKKESRKHRWNNLQDNLVLKQGLTGHSPVPLSSKHTSLMDTGLYSNFYEQLVWMKENRKVKLHHHHVLCAEMH